MKLQRLLATRLVYHGFTTGIYDGLLLGSRSMQECTQHTARRVLQALRVESSSIAMAARIANLCRRATSLACARPP